MSTDPRIASKLAGWLAAATLAAFGTAHAAVITVDSLADDVFPNDTGAIFDAGNNPIVLASAKCTLRMAIASANLDMAVGGATFGCAAGAAGADTIVFAASLNLATTPGTITLADKLMSEFPASYTGGNVAGLAIAGPLTITGPGSSKLTLDGILLAATGNRILTVSDGSSTTDSPVTITGLRFYRGRSVDVSAGCMFSSESTTLSDVTFENCESVGGPTNQGFGGALGLGNLISGGTYQPTISITNSAFLGNRAVRGTNTQRAENGGAFIGSGTRMAGAVTLSNVVFNGNSAERQGAMLIENAASVTITGSHFIGNAATGSNSATDNANGRFGGFSIVNITNDVTINGTTRVNGNVANEERGGFSVRSVGGTTTIHEVDVTGNYVNRGRIGGFEVLTDTFGPTDPTTGNSPCLGLQLKPVNISNVRVMGNSVATNTGGFRIICSGALNWTHGWVAGNETRGYRLLPTDVVATGTSAGVLSPATDATAAQSTAVLTDIVFQGNSTNTMGAGGGGSGVFAVTGLGAFTGDSLRFVENYLDGNVTLALSANGAGRNYLIVNSEFSSNEAQLFAAMFIQSDGNYTLRNSTVSGNRGRGSHIVSANANTNTPNGIHISIEHSTIARNVAGAGEAFSVFAAANIPNPGVTMATLFGGGNATISVVNSILGPRAPGFIGASTVSFDAPNGVTNVTADHSLLENAGGAPAGFCAGTGMICDVGAVLSPLADNGSFYNSGLRTMALMAGSPAINAGGAVLGALSTDARGTGFPRVTGSAVDMGAFESAPATTYGCTLDADGNGTNGALTDGLVFMRALFGLTGASVTNGAVGGGTPTRPDWTSIRNYLNSNCGTKFGP